MVSPSASLPSALAELVLKLSSASVSSKLIAANVPMVGAVLTRSGLLSSSEDEDWFELLSSLVDFCSSSFLSSSNFSTCSSTSSSTVCCVSGSDDAGFSSSFLSSIKSLERLAISLVRAVLSSSFWSSIMPNDRKTIRSNLDGSCFFSAVPEGAEAGVSSIFSVPSGAKFSPSSFAARTIGVSSA